MTIPGVPFAPPIGPEPSTSYATEAAFNAFVADYTGGTEIKYNTDVVKSGLTPAVEFFLHSGTGIVNQTGPED